MQYRNLNVVIVGGSKTGKTSLIKRTNKKFKKAKDSTEDLIIRSWEFSPLPDPSTNITFNIWDFPTQVWCYSMYCNRTFTNLSLSLGAHGTVDYTYKL